MHGFFNLLAGLIYLIKVSIATLKQVSRKTGQTSSVWNSKKGEQFKPGGLAKNMMNSWVEEKTNSSMWLVKLYRFVKKKTDAHI